MMFGFKDGAIILSQYFWLNWPFLSSNVNLLLYNLKGWFVICCVPDNIWSINLCGVLGLCKRQLLWFLHYLEKSCHQKSASTSILQRQELRITHLAWDVLLVVERDDHKTLRWSCAQCCRRLVDLKEHRIALKWSSIVEFISATSC